MPVSARILLVDDDYLIAADLQDTLAELGYEVVGPFLNLNDALDHAEAANIDFALLDFDLGNGTDSTPIAEALSKRGVPFAFVTGTDPDVVKAAFAKAPVIAKPVAPHTLKAVLPAL